MPDKHPEYWKIRTAVLAAQMARLQAEAAVAAVPKAEAALRHLLQMNSLDPDQVYAMNDAEESFTPTHEVPK